MSVKLDFTDMFRSDDNGEKENCKKALNLNKERTVEFEDTKYIQNLQEERSHWQEQTSEIAVECENLRYQVSQLQKEKERDQQTHHMLRQEISNVNSKMGALVTEQRELRNHWLAEKNELESKNFQMQSVLTQFQGTLRKKEKDFEKLQSHLQKQVKDSQRNVKSSIVVSKQLVKNSSQANTVKIGTLRDAELIAQNQKVSTLEMENSQLRVTLEVLSNKIIEFREQCEAKIAMADAKYVYNSIELQQQLQQSQLLIQSLQEEQTLSSNNNNNSNDIDATAPTAPTVVTAVPESPSSAQQTTATTKALLPTTPLSSRNLPVNYLTDHITTEMKKFSDRCLEVATPNNNITNTAKKYKQVLFEDEVASGSSTAGAAAVEVRELKEKLRAALKLVNEQDALIHQALLGQLPGLVDCDGLLDDLEPRTVYKTNNNTSNTSVTRSQLKYTIHSTEDSNDININKCSLLSELDWEDKDFLPPASPATRILLQQCGISPMIE